jgi:hypothetical protein
MSNREKNRQKKLAKQKAKRKARQQCSSSGGGSQLMLQQGLNAPLTDCMVYGNLEDGMMTVSLFRNVSGGNGVVAGFCVDLYCLGVKDSFVNTVTRAKFNELMDRRTDSRPMPAEDAKKLIEEAVAFAESCGITPHRDYAKAMRYLHDVDSSESTATFNFGKDGKPLFVAGPNDTPARCEAIRQALDKHVGDGNYDFILVPDGFF